MKLIIIIQITVLLVVGIGWVKNLIKLTECDFEAPYACEVVHIVGIIPPVGMITGWIDVGE